MTDPDTLATDLVDRLAADLPDTAPPPSLVTAGRALRRKRRRTAIGAALAAVVVAIAGIAVVPQVLVGDKQIASSPVPTPFPDPPTGTRWVGQGNVVVAVPESWPISDLACGTYEPFQVMSYYPVVSCDALAPGVLGSVEFSGRYTSTLPRERRGCPAELPLRCFGIEVFADQQVVVTVSITSENAKAEVDRILDSAMRLPTGWTTVPFESNTRIDQRIEALEQAGFEVTHDAPADFVGAYVASSPELGTPIEVGGTITLTPAQSPTSGLAMFTRPRTTTAGGDLDLVFPTGAERGLYFTLEMFDGTSWHTVWELVATNGDGEPTWQAPGGTGPHFSMRVSGTGPDRVVVPPGTPSGDYRICVLDQDLCTPIVVTP